MAAKMDQAAKESIPSTTSATAGAAVVTITAPTNQGQTIYITGLVLSSSGTIASAVAATLAGIRGSAGTAVTLTMQIPPSPIAPIVMQFTVHPLACVPGTDAVLTLPSLGGGITGTATIFYYIGTV